MPWKTTNSTIKKLEKNGLITLKAGKYPNMPIYLTELGEKYIKEHIVPIIDIQTSVMESVPDSDFENLEKTYSKYIKIFKNEINKLIQKTQK
jgi:DNA-binding PadR family transcriptional regulator